jgi:hypothetical protein
MKRILESKDFLWEAEILEVPRGSVEPEDLKKITL